MTYKKPVSKEIVVQAIIDSIENEDGHVDIKARYLKGFETPEKIIRKGKDQEGYTPDVTVQDEDRIELYEVVLDEKVELDKWRLFSLFTSKGKRHFNIVTPEEQLPRVRDLLKSSHISARLIYF